MRRSRSGPPTGLSDLFQLAVMPGAGAIPASPAGDPQFETCGLCPADLLAEDLAAQRSRAEAHRGVRRQLPSLPAANSRRRVKLGRRRTLREEAAELGRGSNKKVGIVRMRLQR